MTVGVVQRQVSVGMPGSAVLEALGSPNIVSTDEKRREVWVYDKISTERAYSSDAGAHLLYLWATADPLAPRARASGP